ncbi:MAG: RNA polymerase sigma factor [bacterium]
MKAEVTIALNLTFKSTQTNCLFAIGLLNLGIITKPFSLPEGLIQCQINHRIRRSEQLVPDLKNEREVIQRCQRGDMRAFEKIYRHYQQPLLNLGLRMLGRMEDVEDAVQTTFLKLYRGIEQFRFGAKLQTYLFRIMLNVCFDQLQKKKQKPAEFLEKTETVYQTDNELKIQLEEAIQALPQRMRACFVLFPVQQCKQKEIAEILDMNLSTVKAHIFQAKTRLRRALAEFKNEG